MIESPVLRRLVAEVLHKAILGALESRFGPVPPEVATAVTHIADEDRLQELNRVAAVCPDLDAFRQALAA
jgi:hypothetical protein